MKNILSKIKPKIFSKRYSKFNEFNELSPIQLATQAVFYHLSLNFENIPYHNKPFGFFWHTRNKTMDPLKLKTLIKEYNNTNKKEGINFDETDFLENAKEAFEYTRPLLFEENTEIQNLDVLTKDCLDNLTRFYKTYTTELKNYELSMMDTKIDSFSSFKTDDDLFTYVRVEVIYNFYFLKVSNKGKYRLDQR
jgi:hypothetical protein